MKYIILILLTILFITGCQLYPSCGLYFDSLEEIDYFIQSSIQNKFDIGNDHWQYPWDTLELGTGDCEDKAILFLWLAYNNFGIKGEILAYSTIDNTQHHAVAKIDNYLFNYTYLTPVLSEIYDYDYVFFICDLHNLGN